MNDLRRPPTNEAEYQLHVRVLSGILGKVPRGDRPDVLQSALTRACARWDPARGLWKPWFIKILQGEVARYFQNWRPTSPLPDDLPGYDTTSQFFDRLDHAMLLDRLTPSQQRAVTAHTGGSIAHRARLQLRQLIEKEVS